MRSALELLKLATEKWPPATGMRHSFTQLNGVLVLSVVQPDGTMVPVNFDNEEDLDKDATTSLLEISALFDAPPV